jgi:flagellar M-ring protein FliF
MNALVSFFDGLGRSARAGLIAGAALVLAGMVVAMWWLFTPDYEVLFADMADTDSAEVAKALDEWKVPHRFTAGGAAIEVPADQVYATRMKLVSAGVPSGGHVGFELFDDADFGVTEFAQRVNYQRAMQGELERSIGALPGVESVRVHLTIRRPGLFVGQQDGSKASVAIGMVPGEMLAPQQVAGIRNLVAAAVDGLDPAQVIVLGPGGVLAGGGGGDGLLAQNEEQSAYESRVRERIGDLLGQVFKLPDYRVSVDVRLNFDHVHKVSERVLAQNGSDAGLVVRKRTSHSGTVATADGTAPVPGQSQEEVDYAHGTEREEITRGPGQVERISVAVLVPPTLSPAEMDRLRKLVTAAAGLDTERGDRLEIGAIAERETTPADANPVLNPERELTTGGIAATATGDAVRKTPVPMAAWFVLAGIVGLLLGWLMSLAMRPKPAPLRDEEREAIQAKIRSWLAEGTSA